MESSVVRSEWSCCLWIYTVPVAFGSHMFLLQSQVCKAQRAFTQVENIMVFGVNPAERQKS